MPLADHKPTTQRLPGPTCSISRLIDTLDEHDRAELQSWLDDTSLQHSQITDSLRAAGYAVSRQQLSWHRRGECKCGRSV